MRKIVASALFAALLLTLVSCSGKTNPIVIGGNSEVKENVYVVTGENGKQSFEYEITEKNTIAITGYTGSFDKHQVVIPDRIDSIEVTEIGPKAFYYDNSITTVTIPETVTKIGAWAFAGCTYLENINIPETVTEIGAGAFYKCTSLSS
ncbi:MAG TPA: leucine-rich repeat domain-containing protein, partial [Bacillota bacterium]|nr:leucine-rich repeat domain-containing protein [Bacillota bacterium]